MKYIKKFELRTIGKMNNNIPTDFKFAINVKNSSDEEKLEILSELGKYFDIDNDMKNDCMRIGHKDRPWIWILNIWESWGNAMQPRLSLSFSFIVTSNFIYENDVITAEEFLMVGIEGVKTLLDSKKYNI